MPRYFAWNENASRTRGSRKYRLSSRSSDSHGRSSGSILSIGQFSSTERQPRNGFSSEYWKRASFSRLSARKRRDRKSTRLNSSHANISYAVFCLKKQNAEQHYLSYLKD